MQGGQRPAAGPVPVRPRPVAAGEPDGFRNEPLGGVLGREEDQVSADAGEPFQHDEGAVCGSLDGILEGGFGLNRIGEGTINLRECDFNRYRC